MAQYKYTHNISQSLSAAFDTRHAPGTAVTNPGIYRCAGCGDEIAMPKHHKLPPQNHHQHTPRQGRIEWQLLVFAQQSD